jgi:hypothetical protein
VLSKSLLRSAVFVLASFGVGIAHSPAVQALDGPLEVTAGTYKLLGRDEPLVATDRKVDLWAEVYRPKVLKGQPLPLAVFLHGNHGTCGFWDKSLQIRRDTGSEYTRTGECPEGQVVAPSHLGYEYLARELASWGYIVVSINANRGITAGDEVEGDGGLNLMRGRLILRHLALLSDWNRGTGEIPVPATLQFNPRGTMDFSQVGLMGHSRGGEGARAALQQFRDAGSPFQPLIGGLAIRSIFEIGPVDGQTSRVLDADGVDSMVLLPACDGDVSTLDGMRVFDRVFLGTKPDTSKTFYGTVYVWGANHNAYNTEWQESDSSGCIGTDPIFQRNGRSKPQQVTAVETLVPFFRATVGAKADRSLAAQFDPGRALPSALLDITNVDRGYLPAPLGDAVQRLETFSQKTTRSDAGIFTTASGVEVVHQAAAEEHQPGTRVATVSWAAKPNESKFFRVNFRPAKDMSAFKTLSFRTALRCFDQICDFPASADGELAYSVQLVDGDGRSSKAYLTSRDVRISRPLGVPPIIFDGIEFPPTPPHSTLYTVQIPLSALSGVDLGKITAVRFIFDGRQGGKVDIADLMLLKTEPAAATFSPQVAARRPTAWMASATVQSKVQSQVQSMSVAPADPAADANTLTVVRKPAAARPAGVSARAASELATVDDVRKPAAAEAGDVSARAASDPAMVDVVLASKRPFPVTDAFPRLRVGDKIFKGGTVGPDGKTMTIRIPEATYDALPAGADVTLLLQASSAPWKFGPLPK